MAEKEVVVKYGIVGIGMMGREHLLNLYHLRHQGVAVVCIADLHTPSQQPAVELAESFNWPLKVYAGHKEMLDSGLCDIVIVSSPNMTHYGILMDIIAHPKPHHVLVEKPLCTTVAHYKEVKNWNRFNANTGGTLVEKCCRFFDLTRLFAGVNPVRVMTSGAMDVNHKEEVYDGKVPDIIDNAYVFIEFDNGSRGMIFVCLLKGVKMSKKYLLLVTLERVKHLYQKAL